MESEKMNNKSIILLVIGILTLILTVSGATYAFFQAQGGASDSDNVNVTTATTDLFTLNIENELSLANINQATMADDATSNPSTSTLATAELKANNTSDADPQAYYMYLVADYNIFTYTKDSNTPELLLKLEYNTGGDNYVEITDSNKASYQGVTLEGIKSGITEGLTYKTVNDGTNREASGWDITTEKFVKIIENKAINAAQNTTTTDKYRVTITFVNLVGHDQQANTGKTYNGQLVLQKEELVPKYWNDGFSYTDSNQRVYAYPKTPDETYGNVAALRDGYGTANFDSKPFYIKTTTEHQVCLYYNNKEFCMSRNYWDTDVETTKAKLKADMESALGVPISSCASASDRAFCYVSGFSCHAYPYGTVRCDSGDGTCSVHDVDTAYCTR